MTNQASLTRNRTVHGVLADKVTQYGNREFFRFGDQVFGYQDLDRESNKVAAGMQALGLAKGDKVAIMLDNRPEYLFLWFGLSKLGAVEVPLNTAHKGDLLTYMIDRADCRLIVIDQAYLPELASCLANLPKLERVIVMDDAGVSLTRPMTSYGALVANDGAFKAADVIWSDPLAILFTSGTTGPSKGAVMPQNYPVYLAEILTRAARYSEADCLYNALPFFHGNAQFLSTMPALYSGARMVVAPRFSASAFWDDVRRYGCTEFNYIGGIIPILLKAEEKPNDADNPLRIMLGGGCPVNLFEPFQKRFGVRLIEGYGMSEIGLPLMNTVDDPRSGNCGRVHPDYEVKLVDEDGVEVGADTPGELLIRSKKPYCVLLEYYNMPEKTVEAWRDLWFHTGDFLKRDAEGYFYFLDRKKDALRRRGENISSYEVEKVINSHPAVLESAAVAAASELAEDEVMVCLTCRPGKTVTPEDLIEYCEQRMAYFMVPRYVRIMDKLPKTPTERIQKYRLREEGVTPDTWDRERNGKGRGHARKA
ncbi:MAG: ATP-dependent acyl-CoA ligase [Proteobacteria bacterium]|nr:MAG: ATP-dependent acyl-CoA ligase [Pseudomonadota bacterium]